MQLARVPTLKARAKTATLMISSLRNLTLSVATCGCALALAGCGGGGSGPSAPPRPTATPAPNPTPGATPNPTPGATPNPTPGATPTPTQPPITPGGGNQLLFDDFNSGTLNSSVWSRYVYPQQLQRTGWGNNSINMSEGGTSFTRLTLDSYNPDAPGTLFRGTEIFTKNSYSVGNGLEAEARLRAPGLPSGVLFAFFLIRNRYVGSVTPANYRKDEIDFEGLTRQQDQFGGRNRLYTNAWNNWNEALYGFDGDSANNGLERKNDDLVYQPSVDPNFDYANWNNYKIRWFPDRTEFYVNDKLERTETEVKPDQAMELHFNFWTPTGDFQQAFSGNLPGPVASPNNADRRVYQFDVDYVRVRALGTGAASARIATGAEAAQPLPIIANAGRIR